MMTVMMMMMMMMVVMNKKKLMTSMLLDRDQSRKKTYIWGHCLLHPYSKLLEL